MWNWHYVRNVIQALNDLVAHLDYCKKMSEDFDIYDILQSYIDLRLPINTIDVNSLKWFCDDMRGLYRTLYIRYWYELEAFCEEHSKYLDTTSFFVSSKYKSFIEDMDKKIIDDLYKAKIFNNVDAKTKDTSETNIFDKEAK